MSFSTAQTIIRKEFEAVGSSSEYDSLRIEFFGGETFLEFDSLRQIVEWVQSEEWPVPYRFFATTNGTILTDSMKDWLRSKKDILTVGLSFDGTPEMQNVNRCNSFDKIDVAFFLENYPYQTVKMTVSTRTLKSFAQGVIYLQEKGFEVDPSCACGEDWDADCGVEYQKQLYELAEYYLANPEVKPVDLLTLRFHDVLLPCSPQPFCGAGKGFITYDITGEAYPCHMFTPLVSDKSAANRISAESFQKESRYVDPRCENCVVVNICTTCYGYNYGRSGRIDCRDPRLCDLFQSQCKAAAWFQLRLFEIKKQRRELFSPDEIENMKGVVCFFKKMEKLGFSNVFLDKE